MGLRVLPKGGEPRGGGGIGIQVIVWSSQHLFSVAPSAHIVTMLGHLFLLDPVGLLTFLLSLTIFLLSYPSFFLALYYSFHFVLSRLLTRYQRRERKV